MAGKYIAAGLVGSFAISYVCDHFIAEKKIFGGMESDPKYPFVNWQHA